MLYTVSNPSPLCYSLSLSRPFVPSSSIVFIPMCVALNPIMYGRIDDGLALLFSFLSYTAIRIYTLSGLCVCVCVGETVKILLKEEEEDRLEGIMVYIPSSMRERERSYIVNACAKFLFLFFCCCFVFLISDDDDISPAVTLVRSASKRV